MQTYFDLAKAYKDAQEISENDQRIETNRLAIQDAERKRAEQTSLSRAQDFYNRLASSGEPVSNEDFMNTSQEYGIDPRAAASVLKNREADIMEKVSASAISALQYDKEDPMFKQTLTNIRDFYKKQGVDLEKKFGPVQNWTKEGIISQLVGKEFMQKFTLENQKMMQKSAEKKETGAYKIGQLVDVVRNGKTYQGQVTGFDEQGIPQFGNLQQKPDKKLEDNSEKPLSGDTAGKLAMLSQASRDVEEAKTMLFPNGKLDVKRLTSGFLGAPSELGREINSRIDNAVAAKLRAETGAAATPGEVDNISKRFKPKPGIDDENAVSDKLIRLKEYIDEAAYYIDPQGSHRAGAKKSREATGYGGVGQIGRFKVRVKGGQ